MYNVTPINLLPHRQGDKILSIVSKWEILFNIVHHGYNFQKSLHYSYYQLSCDQKNSLGNLKTFIPCASSCAHLNGIVLVCNK